MNQGRIAGILLIAVAVVLFGGAFAWGSAQTAKEAGAAGALDPAAFTLLLVITGVIALLLAGAGVYLLVKSREEAVDAEEAAKQRQILDMVQTRGSVELSTIAIEQQDEVDVVRARLERLVGMGVFSGYINWQESGGMLYSAEAGELRDLENCKNCGGEIKLSGKGVAQCPWCGAEYFLT